MNMKIYPSVAEGNIKAPPSKSMAHRLLICAGLSSGGDVPSCIKGLSMSQDISATLDCLTTLGAGIEATENKENVKVWGTDMNSARALDALLCRESGSTLRFFIPLALLSGNEAIFKGAPSLMKRPLSVYEDICKMKKLTFERDGDQLKVKGKLRAGEYILPGDISSQFVTGLLLALPLADGDSVISILPPVESRSYIDLTFSAMRKFGIKPEWRDSNTIFIPGGQRYMPCDLAVEGDYSNAAFLEAFNLLGGNVNVTGLDPQSLQGDRVYSKVFDKLKAGGSCYDIEDCPDLGPIFFAMAAALNGGTFTGTRRLRIKESDRAKVMAEELSKFGVKLIVEDNRVIVPGGGIHAPLEELDGHNDHRIVMSMAVLCSVTGGVIKGWEAVNKSYPEFWNDINGMGIKTEVI